MSTPPSAGSGPSSPERCSRCRSGALTRLAMVLTDGTDVTFVSCQACEQREWLAVGEDGSLSPLPITTVLARAAKPKP